MRHTRVTAPPVAELGGDNPQDRLGELAQAVSVAQALVRLDEIYNQVEAHVVTADSYWNSLHAELNECLV